MDKSFTKKMDIFAELLITENKKYNLTAITDKQQIFNRHILDSLAAIDVIKKYLPAVSNPDIVDIGSGAGLPGIVLAAAMPNANITSIEATAKKANFQRTAADKLKLSNFKAVHGRAEELGHNQRYRGKFDIATARAVAKLNILCELGLGLVRAGGLMLAWKGAKLKEELLGGKEAAKIMSGQIKAIEKYTLGQGKSDLNIVVISKSGKCPQKYPRKFAAIKKRPLGQI